MDRKPILQFLAFFAFGINIFIALVYSSFLPAAGNDWGGGYSSLFDKIELVVIGLVSGVLVYGSAVFMFDYTKMKQKSIIAASFALLILSFLMTGLMCSYK